jgi:hypothetical protein
MKSPWFFGALLAVGGSTSLFSLPTSKAAQLAQAQVLGVQKHEVASPQYSGGGTPSDAPLESEYYAFDVSVRVKCATYVARYETPFDYFPLAFAPGETTPVRVTKHILYFHVPDHEEMKMAIVRHAEAASTICSSN